MAFYDESRDSDAPHTLLTLPQAFVLAVAMIGGLLLNPPPAHGADSAFVHIYGYCLESEEADLLASTAAQHRHQFDGKMSELVQRNECEDWRTFSKRIRPQDLVAMSALTFTTGARGSCTIRTYRWEVSEVRMFTSYAIGEEGEGCP